MAANLYVTAAALKNTLSLTGETFADADVNAAVEAASRGLDEGCGRRFWADPDALQVRYYDATGDLVRIDDLVTLTTLATDPGGDGTYEQTWTRDTDFVLSPLNAPADGRPWETVTRHPSGSHRFPAGYPRAVRVTGRFGWPAVPPAIAQATTILAAKLLKRSREAPFGVVSMGLDGAAVHIARTDPDVGFLVRPFIRGGRGFA